MFISVSLFPFDEELLNKEKRSDVRRSRQLEKNVEMKGNRSPMMYQMLLKKASPSFSANLASSVCSICQLAQVTDCTVCESPSNFVHADLSTPIRSRAVGKNLTTIQRFCFMLLPPSPLLNIQCRAKQDMQSEYARMSCASCPVPAPNSKI